MKLGGRFQFPLKLKADEILTEEVFQNAVDEAAHEEGKLTLPVTFKGVLVGYADLYRDGSFTASLGGSDLGRELRQQFLEGAANCISVGPNPKGPILPFQKKEA